MPQRDRSEKKVAAKRRRRKVRRPDRGEPPTKPANGDWGELGTATWGDQELREGLRIFSTYTLSTGVKIYIFTEDDRSLTAVHLPEEAHLVGLPQVSVEPMSGWTRTWRR